MPQGRHPLRFLLSLGIAMFKARSVLTTVSTDVWVARGGHSGSDWIFYYIGGRWWWCVESRVQGLGHLRGPQQFLPLA